ncbi:MAG: radical SAM/SPASM domain protein, ACGX system [Methanobrevibacter sp.]|nr:radical SAM/SPASM domain protein, ACGX system [Methanobrevibacter sp.]
MNRYFAFQWHILDDCDQRCKHCYIFEEGEKSLDEMSFEDMSKIIDNALEMCDEINHKPYFAITGGDPILHPDFWGLLEKLDDLKIAYSVMGNPFHLNDEVCKRLKDLNCRQYQMSLDGLRKTHDYFRKPGSFDETISKIKTLRDAGIRSSIMTTVSKLNINQIPWIVDEVVRNKVDLFSFARYCPSTPQDRITPLEYRNLLEKLWEKFNQYNDSNTIFSLKDHLWTLFLFENGLFEVPQNLKEDVIYDGCSCGIDHLTILPNADVYACRRMESKVGNALSQNLIDIFKSSELGKFRQYEKFEKCSDCELLRFCRGCPAVSYSYTKNMYSADPQCWV